MHRALPFPLIFQDFRIKNFRLHLTSLSPVLREADVDLHGEPKPATEGRHSIPASLYKQKGQQQPSPSRLSLLEKPCVRSPAETWEVC